MSGGSVLHGIHEIITQIKTLKSIRVNEMYSHLIRLCIIFVLASMMTACGKHPYVEMEERELASGVRYDSLFLGLSLGMERKAFFDRSWVLNKEKVIKQGPGNNTVEYHLTAEFKEKVIAQFYPTFSNDVVYEVPMTMSYEAWAPWNKYLFADSLQLEALTYFEKQYGEGFVEIKHPSGKRAFAKVDGNRRISISKIDDRQIKVLFTDLTAEKPIAQ